MGQAVRAEPGRRQAYVASLTSDLSPARLPRLEASSVPHGTHQLQNRCRTLEALPVERGSLPM